MTKIVIAGDICPGGHIEKPFVEGKAEEIYHDLLPQIQEADLSVANLECPLVENQSPIAKSGPVLDAPIECIRGFSAAGWDVLNLANNHSFDHGSSGLATTIKTVERAGMDTIGAGANLAEANAPLVRDVKGQRIVMHSMAEREFSVADETHAGSNPLDLINFVQVVREYKQNGIFISLVHGGREYFPYPSPEMVRRSRFMIEMGADAVICCHTHCPLPWETYNGCPIVYGMGNFIFEDEDEDLQSWHQGYLTCLEIEHRKVSLKTIPYTQSQGFLGARSMDDPNAVALVDELLKRAEEINDSNFLMGKWRELCQQERSTYFAELFAYPSFIQRLRRLLLPVLHSKKAIMNALLLVQCETHREILETLFLDERVG